jgi:hypothetical protein
MLADPRSVVLVECTRNQPFKSATADLLIRSKSGAIDFPNQELLSVCRTAVRFWTSRTNSADDMGKECCLDHTGNLPDGRCAIAISSSRLTGKLLARSFNQLGIGD